MKKNNLVFIFCILILILILVLVDKVFNSQEEVVYEGKGDSVDYNFENNVDNSVDKNEESGDGGEFTETIIEEIDNKEEEPDIKDGSLIRQEGTNDIYLVKVVGQKRFKRLVLNPDILNSYEDIEWGDVIDVPLEVLFSYKESNLVMEVDKDGNPVDGSVYRIESHNDTGVKYLLDIRREEFESYGYDWDSVYFINHTEASDDFYKIENEVLNKACSQDWLDITKRILKKINVPSGLCIELVSQDSAVGKFILSQGVDGFYIVEDDVIAVVSDIGVKTVNAEVHEICHSQQDWYMTKNYGVSDDVSGWVDTNMGLEFVKRAGIEREDTSSGVLWSLPSGSLLEGMYGDNDPIELAAEVCTMSLLWEEGVYHNRYGYEKDEIQNILGIGNENSLFEWYQNWILK